MKPTYSFDRIMVGSSGGLSLRSFTSELYRAGTWGPKKASEPLSNDRRRWFQGGEHSGY